MTRISEKEAREILGDKYPEKTSKYNSKKTTVDGITFHSQAEAEYYCQLKLRVRAGELSSFDIQPVYLLQEGFHHHGKWYPAINYKADFRLYYPDGKVEVIDVKGFRTREYLIKRKLLLKRYPDINFIEEVV